VSVAVDATGGRPSSFGSGVVRAFALACALALLAACASRPGNPKLANYEHSYGYRISNWPATRGDPEFGLIVTMSGGGIRAAALAYGVLEELRRTPIPGANPGHTLLDEVKMVTGVSGGAFTALAFALYGNALFADYEKRFLKRDVQGELIGRVASPLYWPSLASPDYTRTELAADYYDEILFEGTTFADLAKKRGHPFANVSATEISSNARLTFNQNTFDILCSDLGGVRLARAAAASSAVPVVFAPLTFDNYAGSCGFDLNVLIDLTIADVDRRKLRRAHMRKEEFEALADGANHRYLHLVDGGVADNLGLRTVIEALELAVASRGFRAVSGFDRLQRFAVIVVNSHSAPDNDWGTHESPPGIVGIVLKSATISITRYSYEQTEILHDYVDRHNEAMGTSVPSIEVFLIDVAFDVIADPVERRYFTELPTTFSLSAEQVDRLREIGGRLLRESQEYKRLLCSLGAPGCAG
jgi:NTE family protein